MSNKREVLREQREVLRILGELRDDMHTARLQFNQAVEPELVDACVFELNALQSRYNYYLRVAREEGINQSYVEQSAGVPV
jgi:hypothetical protein